MAKNPLIFVQNLVRWMGFGGSGHYSGEQLPGPLRPSSANPVNVTEDVALTLSAVFGAVRILVETVAGIPMFVYVRRGGQWVVDETDELWTMLTLRPNPHMTGIEFWEAVLLNLVLRGNGYALILRNSAGMPIGLYPLSAAQMQPVVLADGTGWYVYSKDGLQTMHAEEDMLHFRIFGNGRIGMSPLQYGALSMGIASASDQYAGQFFTRGGKPGGVLRIDRLLTPRQREEVRAAFKEVHEGEHSAHKLFVLEAGMQYQQVQLAPEALQMIETRRFSVKDVARFWGVPAFLLNESEGSTSWGTGLEQQMLGFYNLTVRPYTLRISAGLRSKLVPIEQQRRKKVAYDFDELLAVDLRSKAEYYTKLRSAGIMTGNEIRERLLLPKATDKNADKLLIQGAMVPLDKLGMKPAAALPKPEGNGNDGTQEPDPVAE